MGKKKIYKQIRWCSGAEPLTKTQMNAAANMTSERHIVSCVVFASRHVSYVLFYLIIIRRKTQFAQHVDEILFYCYPVIIAYLGLHARPSHLCVQRHCCESKCERKCERTECEL